MKIFSLRRSFATTVILMPFAMALTILLSAGCGPNAPLHPEWRGLLASPGFEGTAMKGVYFFPGRGREGQRDEAYTTHPLDERDLQWNKDSTREWVMDRMIRAHVNTVVMSYFSNMPQWSPMDVCSSQTRRVVCKKHPEIKFCVESASTVPEVIKAVQGRPLVIMPAIEQGNDDDCPEVPHWKFPDEFPSLPFELPDNPDDRFAPNLVARIGRLVELFRGKMDRWAQIYDRDGKPRYAVQIIHVSSNVIDQKLGDDTDDKLFANGFKEVARVVSKRYHIDIGFMIDTVGTDCRRYCAFPEEAGAALEQTPSVLAVQGFASEIFSGLIINSAEPCVKTERGLCEPHDNNRDNLERMANWKREAIQHWLDKGRGLPVILDVVNGYDARYVFGGTKELPKPVAFWGDNLNYTEDRWRNWMSELKGPGIKGIVVDTWNGYTEGYTTVPSIEHGQTVYNWLTDLLEPPPWDCSHMHYVNGARTHRVFGAICEKWIQLGGDRGFGAPVSEELPSARGRAQYFADQKAIYWGGKTGAHAVFGLIAKAYREAHADAGCLGLPVSDEEDRPDGRVTRFEHGTISWKRDDPTAHVNCQ